MDLLQNCQGKKINSRQKQNTEKQSELAAQHSRQNELTPRQTENIEAAKKKTLKIYGAVYVSHFKPAFV